MPEDIRMLRRTTETRQLLAPCTDPMSDIAMNLIGKFPCSSLDQVKSENGAMYSLGLAIIFYDNKLLSIRFRWGYVSFIALN